MDIHFELNGDLFVWSDKKADSANMVSALRKLQRFLKTLCSCWWMLPATMKHAMQPSDSMRPDAYSTLYISSLRQRVFESFPAGARNQKRS